MKKMFLKSSLMIMIVFLFFTYSYSADWNSLSFSKDKNIYIDCNSIFTDENTITFWTKEEDKDNHLQSKAKITIDCNKRKFSINEALKYDDKGSVISKDSSEDYVGIPSGSIMDTAGQLLCDENNKPRKNYKEYLKSWGNFVNKKRKEIKEE